MVWDVDLIVFFHQTTQKENVLSLLLAINREDNVHSTTSLQVQHMEVSRPRRRSQRRTNNFSLIDIRVFFFYYFNFQPKATRAGDEKHRKKKHMALQKNCSLPTSLYLNASSLFWQQRWNRQVCSTFVQPADTDHHTVACIRSCVYVPPLLTTHALDCIKEKISKSTYPSLCSFLPLNVNRLFVSGHERPSWNIADHEVNSGSPCVTERGQKKMHTNAKFVSSWPVV